MSLFKFRRTHVVLPNTASADLPAADAANIGGIVYDSTHSAIYFSNGSSWASIASGGSAHAMLSSTHSDSTAAAVARGAIITGQGSTAAWTKLTKGGAACFLTGDGTDVAWSTYGITLGGALVTNAAMTITLTTPAQGDILYRTASAWVNLPAGTSGQYLQTQGVGANPAWATVTAGTAGGLTNLFTLEGGTYDPITTITAQSTSAAALTIPDLGGTAQEWVFSVKAQTLQNKALYSNCTVKDASTPTKIVAFDLSGITASTTTLTFINAGTSAITFPAATSSLATLALTETLSGKTLTAVKIVTTDGIFDAGGDEYLTFTEGTTPVTYVNIASGNTTVAPIISGIGETNTSLKIKGLGTGNVILTDGADSTKMLAFDIGGTATKTLTIIAAPDNDYSLTLPNATDTLVGKATVDTLTYKTFDCDGTGNVLSNVNATELDPVGDGEMVIPFICQKALANLPVAGTNVITTHPKMRIVDAWFVATSADTGTVQIKVGQVGSVGAAITEALAIAAADHAITRFATLIDAAYTVNANAGLVAIGDGGESVDGILYVSAIRVN